MNTERPAPQPGERRRLVGLVARADLNDCIVTILDACSGDRIPVRTDGTNENIRVRPECLAPLLAATTDSQTAVLYLVGAQPASVPIRDENFYGWFGRFALAPNDGESGLFWNEEGTVSIVRGRQNWRIFRGNAELQIASNARRPEMIVQDTVWRFSKLVIIHHIVLRQRTCSPARVSPFPYRMGMIHCSMIRGLNLPLF